ncbi:MAG: hypothetical protein HYZ89_01990 [Candidatus Omnitrophica bacterium]|nr:hypothetical protein [Candidatus Omnitrophota bacterium]
MKCAISLFFLLTTHYLLLTVPAEAARIEYHEGLPVVYLEGTPYELGRQHGALLRDSVRQAVGQILGYFQGYVKLPIIGRRLANWWLVRPWKEAMPFIPTDYLEELRGLSDSSGVPLKDLWRLHAIPDRTYACSNFAAWGPATAGGRLVHLRNLDWNMHAGIQRHAVVFVVHPTGKQAFVNVGWAGFVGVLTGINGDELSIGQVGAATMDVTPKGIPMAFLMRKVLEESSDGEAAVRIIREAPRTVGVNYVVADAKAARAVAIETTSKAAVVFEADDPKEHAVPYAKPMADVVFRSDTAMDPEIRARQLASGGNPRLPGLEPPTGSAYEVRYLGQAAGLTAHYGRIDAGVAREIAQKIAPDSNVQSVIFAWPELWIANADATTPAAHTPSHRLNLEHLFHE